MHTMVVNNLNEYVFVNCGFLFPFHTQEQKIMYETIIHGLYYCTINHASAKNWLALETRKKSP
jgi:hypothetical protein